MRPAVLPFKELKKIRRIRSISGIFPSVGIEWNHHSGNCRQWRDE
ncbi:hypothetical protein HMPREF1546_02288 [Oscillibacter sp. KLE 1745]|nr:hypothetical protein HMPREF1546_02288 [Oscillibacter sp. KLE 1745]